MFSDSLPIIFASHDGHTRKIAMRLEQRLFMAGEVCTLCDLSQKTLSPEMLRSAPLIILLAPIRFGFHLPAVEDFIRLNERILKNQRLVLVSVNLTARKPEKNTPATNPYFRKWIARHGLEPALAAVFGGMLDYSKCKTWEKWAIRFIMKITGGPTSFDTVADYTDWNRVDAFADDILRLHQKILQEAA